MTEADVIRALGQVDLFTAVKAQTLAGLIRACAVLTLADHEVLFEQGAIGASMYIVLKGQLEVFRGDRIIATVGPHEYVGEMTLLDAAPRSAAVRAVDHATLLEVSRGTFDQFLRADPEALAAIMRTMGTRLRRTLDDTQAAYEHLNMIVHDMLNLLNVLTAADLVIDALPAKDPNRRLLDRIVHTQHTLESMMRGALRKARGESAPYHMSPVRLDDLIHECMDHDVAFHPDVKRVALQVEVETPMTPFACNAQDVRRVIANLLINAAQASAPGEKVIIKLRQTAETVSLLVIDTGHGIPTHIQPWIFEPHFTAKTDGSGLGLNSCLHIVERLHGGKLSFESTEGVGATFVCEFPARTSAVG